MHPPDPSSAAAESAAGDSRWLGALRNAWATVAIDPEIERDQFDVFVSGAVAEWADQHDEDDLVVAARSLVRRLDGEPELRPVRDAVAGLVDGTDDAPELLSVRLVAGIDRSIDSYVLLYGRDGEPTHTMLIDILIDLSHHADHDEIVGIFFGDAEVAAASVAEATADGVSVASQLVTGPELDRVRDRISSALAHPLPDRHANRANALVATDRLRRAGVEAAVVSPRRVAMPYEPRPRDPDADRSAAELLRSALGPSTDPPTDVVVHVERLLGEPVDDPLLELMAVAGCGDWRTDTGDDSVALALRLVAAFVRPHDLSMFGAGERELVDSLEWADWLGAALPAIRIGVGAPMAASDLIDNINRCPEITTSIPKRDRPAMEAAFELVSAAWTETGVIDTDNRLTSIGPWLLTEALRRAATGSS
ncbi:MAG: hypothetical protein HKN26_07665 [Acidimicrobiales bacterium]|nr:hypothetical protein [Acidimicrobiales bacterium]